MCKVFRPLRYLSDRSHHHQKSLGFTLLLQIGHHSNHKILWAVAQTQSSCADHGQSKLLSHYTLSSFFYSWMFHFAKTGFVSYLSAKAAWIVLIIMTSFHLLHSNDFDCRCSEHLYAPLKWINVSLQSLMAYWDAFLSCFKGEKTYVTLPC